MTAPLVSTTVPSMEPSPAVCALAGIAVHTRHSAKEKIVNATLAQFSPHPSSVVADLLNVFREFMGKPPSSESGREQTLSLKNLQHLTNAKQWESRDSSAAGIAAVRPQPKIKAPRITTVNRKLIFNLA